MNKGIETDTISWLFETPVVINGKRTNLSEITGCSSYDSFIAQVRKIEIDREREPLKFIFGERAKIEKEEDKEWLIESVLESRGVVSGGQKFNIILGEKTNLEINGTECVFYDLYPLEELKIKDKLISLAPKIFFSSVKTGQNFINVLTRAQKERIVTDFEYKIFGNGIKHVTLANKYVIMGDFQSAEDLVALLHEVGHTMSENPNQVGEIDHELILESASKLLPGESLNEKENKILLEILKEENEASSQAINIIKNLRKKRIDLFPKDPDLAQVRLFLSMCLSTFLKGLGNYNERKYYV